MEITAGELLTNELTTEAMGGTELLAHGLFNRLDKKLLENFQIVCSRKRDLREDLIRIFWAHDLPGDPESEFLKDPVNHKLFHRYVFVSNWQMQQYISTYGIPWNRCVVIQNAVEPIEDHKKPSSEELLNFVYFSTPHRGLDVLVSVFSKLAEKHSNIHLNVYSSFSLYGWPQRDEPFEGLFEHIKKHPQMSYYGAVSNEEMREALKYQHVLAYPSTWAETSCLTLMEAMSAKLLCLHSNLAALPETAANMTMMYQFNEDKQGHAQTFYNICETAIEHFDDSNTQGRLDSMKAYADTFYAWDQRAKQWGAFLESMLEIVQDRAIPEGEVLVFNTA